MKILIADRISPIGVDLFKAQKGFDVVEAYGSSPEEILELAKDSDAIAVRSDTRITAEVIAVAPNLKVVGRAGVGVDNIVKHWDAMNGSLIDEYKVNTRSKISCFKTFSDEESIKRQTEAKPSVQKLGGTICTTWDGTVILRQLTHNS